MRSRYMDGVTFVAIFLALGTLQISAETDQAQGDGPFKQPLEPGHSVLFGIDRSKPFDGYKVVRAVPKSKANVDALLDLDAKGDIKVDFWIDPGRVNSPVDMMVSPTAYIKLSKFLKGQNIPFSIQTSNVEGHVEQENNRHLGTLFSTYSGFDYGRYHSLSEINQEMNNLASRYSHMANVFSVGKSYEGRSQYAIKISAKKSGNRKVFFFNCAIHAREWVTPATCMYMMNQMLSKYGSDNSVTQMLDKMDWVILPVFNVDGYAYTWSGRSNRMWRKTRSRNGASCLGADPNRNWNYKWGGIGTSSNPCRDTYHGRRAFSEIEVLNVARYLYKIRRNLVGYIDIHAYSQLWMTPWGYTRTYPKDYTEQARVAKIAVNALYNAGYRTSYKYGPSSVIIYATSGGSDDWAYGVLGVKYSYALELRDTGRYGFMLPANQILPTCKETFASFKAMSAAMRI